MLNDTLLQNFVECFDIYMLEDKQKQSFRVYDGVWDCNKVGENDVIMKWSLYGINHVLHSPMRWF